MSDKDIKILESVEFLKIIFDISRLGGTSAGLVSSYRLDRYPLDS